MRVGLDTDQIEAEILQQFIPLAQNGVMVELASIMDECNDLFIRKRKQLQACALLIVFAGSDLIAVLECQALVNQMQMSYEVTMLQDIQLEESLEFYTNNI